MYGIRGEFRRFCFDRAVFAFGSTLEDEVNSISGKTETQVKVKRERLLAKWLDQPLKFRNPTATSRPDTPESVTIKGDLSG